MNLVISTKNGVRVETAVKVVTDLENMFRIEYSEPLKSDTFYPKSTTLMIQIVQQ